MPRKPRTASGYEKTHVSHVRAVCLYVATRLGDLLDDVVVVGGLVPSLLIDQDAVGEKHAGTADLDLGLAVAVFDDKRYEALTDRLRQAGFGQMLTKRGIQPGTDGGSPVRQRSRSIFSLRPPARRMSGGGSRVSKTTLRPSSLPVCDSRS